MGAFCCCPCSEDFEEYARPSNPIYRHCICLRYFFHQLFSGYTATFQRLDGRSASSPGPSATSLTPATVNNASADNSMSETYHLVPRPLPYETDPRYSRPQREGLVSRREKSMSHVHENLQTIRRNGSSSAVENSGNGKKWSSTESDEESKLIRADSEKGSSFKAYDTGYMITSEEEDVCPTCLEEYTPENPKIVAKCFHHFHLSCIYEWMERSDNCPVCGKIIMGAAVIYFNCHSELMVRLSPLDSTASLKNVLRCLVVRGYLFLSSPLYSILFFQSFLLFTYCRHIGRNKDQINQILHKLHDLNISVGLNLKCTSLLNNQTSLRYNND